MNTCFAGRRLWPPWAMIFKVDSTSPCILSLRHSRGTASGESSADCSINPLLGRVESNGLRCRLRGNTFGKRHDDSYVATRVLSRLPHFNHRRPPSTGWIARNTNLPAAMLMLRFGRHNELRSSLPSGNDGEELSTWHRSSRTSFSECLLQAKAEWAVP
jgi:hypothetical protein